MDTSKLKTYAPKARREFIAAVTRRAAKFGITAKGVSPVREEGQLVIIEGEPYPKAVAAQRNKLATRISQQGFHQVMEAAAYTWFNRFAAIRFMELHGYLDHSFRVLSHPTDSALPEILEHAQNVDLPGLDRERVVDLKMDGTRDEELYRDLLLAQCHALHQAMPFLFERVDDESELLLPDNLLQTDSLIRDLVTVIPEEEWQEIEIIGWLYQFYISEKKDQVIGKVVKSEDIPAATQLFTPNWIVKYMVQNSLGAQWLATYPHSPLKGQMEYYIEPAEQTDEVKEQLAAITPSLLNPEELTLIDPACGSGHILVQAYELFKAIYLERGYRQRDLAKLILEKNLFGLDIDERAAQLTGFALMMKGRADDRRLFELGVKLNVMVLVDSTGFDAEGLAKGVELSDYGLKPGDLTELKRLFEHATTFGSLIQVPEGLASSLPALKQLSEATFKDLFVSEALKRLEALVKQAELLAAQYDAVVANPPYINSKFHIPIVKSFLKGYYKGYEKDLFAVFIDRDLTFCKPHGHLGFMTPQVWMFLSSFEKLRMRVIDQETITTLVHPEYNAFWDSAHVALCSFTIQKGHVAKYNGTFIRLAGFYGAALQPRKTLEAISNTECGWLFRAETDAFKKIPGGPLAYWVSESLLNTFSLPSLGESADIRQGMATTDNLRFLRNWTEVAIDGIVIRDKLVQRSIAPDAHWFPYNKGGSFRKWSGNNEFVLDYTDNGEVLIDLVRQKYPRISDPEFVIKNRKYYFRPCASWSDITSAVLSARYIPRGYVFDTAGPSAFSTTDETGEIYSFVALLNSNVSAAIIPALNPTLHFNLENAKSLPVASDLMNKRHVYILVDGLISFAKADWDAYERSWDFQSFSILVQPPKPAHTLESSYTTWIIQNRNTITEMKRLEEENNRLFIDAYGLGEELTPDVPIEQITLTVNPAYRYGGKLTEEEQWTRFREDTMQELVSYAIGCMMGRYSLDAPGLIYAHSGNEGFDHGHYTIFPADADGIVPLTDTEWFEDDAANRLIEFISVAWDERHLEANLTFLANNLSLKKNESSRETLRRYLCDSFFKDHLQTYKKRPIYWFFSSGKQKAFQCLVYLHRYNEGTLARMRMEYVVPLQGKMAARIDKLADDVQAASTGAQAKRLQKERDKLTRQLDELRRYDEQLRHYADLRISLDLDDGVKVNYGKFGDLLSEVKAVTGKKNS